MDIPSNQIIYNTQRHTHTDEEEEENTANHQEECYQTTCRTFPEFFGAPPGRNGTWGCSFDREFRR